MISLEAVAVIIVGYLLGAIPFAVLIARRHGVDILKEGSGNPGATNVKRVLGKKAGNLCFFLDFLKGLVAAGWVLLPFWEASNPVLLSVIGLFAAIIGHSFSVFIRFRGGKGVATTMGGLLAIMPLVLLTGLLLWVIVFYTTRYVSLASLVFGISLPLFGWIYGVEMTKIVLGLILAVLLLVRHRANIVRLLNGTENRFTRK